MIGLFFGDIVGAEATARNAYPSYAPTTTPTW
jgi:hypothetical protein